jgi:hypothetical protein
LANLIFKEPATYPIWMDKSMDETPVSQGSERPATVGLMAHLYNLCDWALGAM